MPIPALKSEKTPNASVRVLMSLRSCGELNRKETMDGVEYMVVPAVAIVEGVLHPSNAPAPELALAAEFGKYPAGWNGRPVVVDHPENAEGDKVSANSPDVFESSVIGFLFNTRVEDKRLKTEAWVNAEKAKRLGGNSEIVVNKLDAGEMVEVSVGAYVSLDPHAGMFEGERYNGVWRDVVPDHLALLSPGKIGASSIADGAGAPRLNSLKACELNVSLLTGEADLKTLIAEPSVFSRVWTAMGSLFRSSQEISDADRRAAIQSALDVEDTEYYWNYVVAVFSDYFIYETGDGLFQRGYDISGDGTVSLGQEKIRVRPETSFVPVKTNEEVGLMPNDRKDLVDALITNKQFTEDDREWLLGLEDTQFEKIAKISEEATKKAVTPEPPKEPVKKEPAAAVKKEPEIKKPTTAEEFLESAPPEIRNVLQLGQRTLSEKRSSLIASIKTNKRNAYSDEDFETMGLEALEKLAKLASDVDYSALGGPGRTAERTDKAPEPPLVFEKKAS